MVNGVPITTVGNIAGLVASLLAFAVLVAGYILVVDKKPMRSDYLFYATIANLALLVGISVAWYYSSRREINTE